MRGDSDLLTDMKLFRKMAAEVGRDPDSMEVSVYAAPADPDRLAELRDAGFTRAIFIGLPMAAEQLLPLLDMYAEVARKME